MRGLLFSGGEEGDCEGSVVLTLTPAAAANGGKVHHVPKAEPKTTSILRLVVLLLLAEA